MVEDMTIQVKNKALTILLCGEVKGVGFRRYVWRIAKSLNLRGYVGNIPGKDCVEIYIEGEESVIEEFKNKIMTNRIYEIDNIRILEQEYLGKYNDFTIIKCLGEEEQI
jgi:hydrogenase maturation protein HypF